MKITPQQASDPLYENYATAKGILASELDDKAQDVAFLSKGARGRSEEVDVLATKITRYSNASQWLRKEELNSAEVTEFFSGQVNHDNNIGDKEGEIARFQGFIKLDATQRSEAIRTLGQRLERYRTISRESIQPEINVLLETADRQMIESHDRLITGTARYVANNATHGYSRVHIEALGRVLHEEFRID